MDVASLTGWDWFVALTALVSIGFGLWHGFVRTVFGLAAWIVAFVGTPFAAPAAIAALRMHEHPWVAFVVVFIVLFVAVRLAGSLIARALAKAGLGGADRVLGGLLGVARALIVITLAVILARGLGLHESASWKLSLTRPLLERLMHLIEPHLPERVSGIRET